ncbi:MAG: hypothetical protein U1E55_06620 [Paracoccus sp. (in: a-proteobacteria)]
MHLRILGFVAGVGIALGALLAVEWARAVPRTELLVFFERQGCVIGPATRGAARDAGFSDADIDALARRTRLVSRAGDTARLAGSAPEICTIRPPAIKRPCIWAIRAWARISPRTFPARVWCARLLS